MSWVMTTGVGIWGAYRVIMAWEGTRTLAFDVQVTTLHDNAHARTSDSVLDSPFLKVVHHADDVTPKGKDHDRDL